MRETVLIVDDCPDITKIIARYLTTAHYRTLTATDGAAALQLLAETQPDCIVLDLMMPGISGGELLHQLRTDPTTRNIPVVLVSARFGFGGGNRLGADAEVDYCVGKPFSRQQIIEAVHAVLPPRRAGADASRLSAARPPAPASRPSS